MATSNIIKERIRASIQVKQDMLQNEALLQQLEQAVEALSTALQQGGKVLFCGNGGSAADAQHLAAELSARFYIDRKPLHAEALHVNTSYLTATANDFDFTEVYARLVEAKGKPGDVLVGLSTSGNSPNVVKAMQRAKDLQMICIGFTGAKAGAMDEACQLLLRVPSTDTPRIQEGHILLGHILCELVEAKLFG